MLLGFVKAFKPKILNETKFHTLRHDPTDRWKKGKTIHFATGIRTKHYQQFKLGVCTGTQRVFMTYAYNDIIEISIDGRQLHDHNEIMAFAKNDGFDTWREFFEWFYPLIEKAPNQELHLKLIHWTDLRY